METDNWIIKKHIQHIQILSSNFPTFFQNYLKERGVIFNTDLRTVQTFIDWRMYPNHYSFFYDFERNEKLISELLRKTDLSKHKYVIMDYGYNAPIIKIETNTFIDYWWEFIHSATYETTVVSADGVLVMEFTRHGYALFSNFKIKNDN